MPTGNDFRSSILWHLCPTKSSSFENFWWRHCMWFVVWAPYQSKILVTPINWRLPEKLFWRPFFFGEQLRLCPWSLTLASSIPVLILERVCPRKGCSWPWPRIFLCPWPWPRALCPRLHLWLISPMLSSLIRLCWESWVNFCSSITYVKFYKVSFGGQNVYAHSLIGIRCKTTERNHIHWNLKKSLAQN